MKATRVEGDWEHLLNCRNIWRSSEDLEGGGGAPQGEWSLCRQIEKATFKVAVVDDDYL